MEMDSLKLKCFVLGSQGSGKTNLIVQYTEGYYYSDFLFTMPNDTKTICIQGKQVTLCISEDCSELPASYSEMHIQNSDLFVICFSLINMDSFNEVRTLHQRIKDAKEKYFSIIIVGTKSDDIEHRVVTDDQIKELSTELRCNYFLTSALQNTNITEAFEFLVNQYIQHIENDKSSHEEKCIIG